MIQLLGVPFDGTGPRIGSALGPACLRLQNLVPVLRDMGLSIEDLGDVQFSNVPQGEGLRNFDTALNMLGVLKSRILEILRSGNTPLVLGGDHSMSVGSLSAALEFAGDDLAVLWIDAHADINTPASSPSGNLHGMPIACAMGMPTDGDPVEKAQWERLQATIVPATRLRSERMAWIGLRDVDPGEQAHIKALQGCFATTMYDVDRLGLPQLVDAFARWFEGTGARHLWISFDVDSLDPVLAPGTGTMVRGGLSYREGHLLAELLAERIHGQSGCKLLGLDVVEVNPILDTHNETAQVAIEWLCSLFGNTILGGYRQNGL